MENSIENLNNVVEQREKMIDTIICAKFFIKNDNMYDRLMLRYGKKSYLELKKLHSQVIKNLT